MEVKAFVFLLFVMQLQLTCATGPLVSTTSGTIEGLNKNGVVNFLGVPYAQPPLGELRFMPPKSYEAGEEVLQAFAHGPACMQNTKMSFYGHPPQLVSEDCLTLNIYVPGEMVDPARSERLSTMVWIHGGAWISGASEQFPGHILASKQNVIVITLNYRLGAFGFLTSGNNAVPGNMGLMDQRLALQWVQNNIGHFGGSGNDVTVFGQSSGGMSISLHMISEQSQGLFTRAICQSGVTTNQILFERDVLEKARSIANFAEALDCDTETQDEVLIECIQNVAAEKIVQLNFWQQEPIVDGPKGFIPQQPSKLWEQGAFANVSLLAGVMKDEGMVSLFMGLPTIPNPMVAMMTGLPGTNASITAHIVLSKLYPMENPNGPGYQGSLFNRDHLKMAIDQYFQHLDDPLDNLRSVVDFFGQSFFLAPTLKAVRSAAGQNSYMYHFSHNRSPKPSAILMGPSHGEDLYFLFQEGLSGSDLYIQNTLMNAWATFAKTGHPEYLKPDGSIHTWPAYDVLSELYLDIGYPQGSSTIQKRLLPRADSFWNTLMPEIVLRPRQQLNEDSSEEEDSRQKRRGNKRIS